MEEKTKHHRVSASQLPWQLSKEQHGTGQNPRVRCYLSSDAGHVQAGIATQAASDEPLLKDSCLSICTTDL